MRTETRLLVPQAQKNLKLQWSRPQLRTETRKRHRDRLPPEGASMEPSSVEDGNINFPNVPAVVCPASMEPSSVEDGNIGTSLP